MSMIYLCTPYPKLPLLDKSIHAVLSSSLSLLGLFLEVVCWIPAQSKMLKYMYK